MVDKIVIIDDFLDQNDLQRIVDYMDRQTFVFGHSSGPYETVNNQSKPLDKNSKSIVITDTFRRLVKMVHIIKMTRETMRLHFVCI